MNDLRKELRIDCRLEEQRIIDFIRQSIAKLHKKGAIIGLSGGLDSSLCAYLLERALGKRKILALLLPERDSSPVHHRHARMVAGNLGLKTVEIDMTRTLRTKRRWDRAMNSSTCCCSQCRKAAPPISWQALHHEGSVIM